MILQPLEIFPSQWVLKAQIAFTNLRKGKLSARKLISIERPLYISTMPELLCILTRFKEWDDPHGETPPYHYGTHYSSAMIVCSYLVRMEPFTQHFLRLQVCSFLCLIYFSLNQSIVLTVHLYSLQGGHFDLADRMFNSIREAWLSASRHNMADVKELIPEFFYLPEFLTNSNNFDLGKYVLSLSFNVIEAFLSDCSCSE